MGRPRVTWGAVAALVVVIGIILLADPAVKHLERMWNESIVRNNADQLTNMAMNYRAMHRRLPNVPELALYCNTQKRTYENPFTQNLAQISPDDVRSTRSARIGNFTVGLKVDTLLACFSDDPVTDMQHPRGQCQVVRQWYIAGYGASGYEIVRRTINDTLFVSPGT